MKICPALVYDRPVHVRCVYIQIEGTYREFRSHTVKMYRLEKY